MEAKQHDLRDVLVVATGPHGFGGAVQAFCRALNALAYYGACVYYVGLDEPYPIRTFSDNRIQFVRADLFHAGAIGSPTSPIIDKHILASHVLSEKMVEVVRETTYSRLIIWGTYLYPFATASLRAKEILQQEEQGSVELWQSVSGSEIWEIGAKIPLVTRSVLLEEGIDHIITSSRQFAEEIQRDFRVERQIEAIYPMIDAERFVPLSEEMRRDVRKELAIPDEAFVMTCHCNMRAVKRPEDVLHIAEEVAKRSERPILLFMIGPLRKHLMELTEEIVHTARVEWMGVSADVETYLQISDVELNCSWHDSFNMSLAEAMACAVPCVSTDVVGVGAEILAADAGFLFPYIPYEEDDEQRYRAAIDYIVNLTESEEERMVMGKRAAEHASRVFAPELITGQYLALFK